MKRFLCWAAVILLLFSSCGTKNSADTSSEITTDQLVALSEQAYQKVTYTGFDTSTTWGTIAHEITEQEDIDNIIKSFQFSGWVPTDTAVQTEQVIRLDFHQQGSKGKRTFSLYLDGKNEYGSYQGAYFTIPEGTYQHIVTLLQSYGHQANNNNNESFDLTQTIRLMLENPKLKVITDQFTVHNKDGMFTEEYLNALSVGTWQISSAAPVENTGSSIYFMGPNSHLSITLYEEECLATISTNLNESVYTIPFSVFNELNAVCQKEFDTASD